MMHYLENKKSITAHVISLSGRRSVCIIFVGAFVDEVQLYMNSPVDRKFIHVFIGIDGFL